jgi:hypothetical protein
MILIHLFHGRKYNTVADVGCLSVKTQIIIILIRVCAIKQSANALTNKGGKAGDPRTWGKAAGGLPIPHPNF